MRIFLALFMCLTLSATSSAQSTDDQTRDEGFGFTTNKELSSRELTLGVRVALDRVQETELRLAMLSEKFGQSHPQVRELKSELEVLRSQLSEWKQLAGMAVTANSQVSVARQRSDYARLEEKAAVVAAQIRNLQLRSADESDDEAKVDIDETIEHLREELADLVSAAFKSRLRMQQQQLADAQAKLRVAEERLAQRKSLADTIVRRRIEELIGGAHTAWDNQALKQVSGGFTAAADESSLRSDDLLRYHFDADALRQDRAQLESLRSALTEAAGSAPEKTEK